MKFGALAIENLRGRSLGAADSSHPSGVLSAAAEKSASTSERVRDSPEQ